MSQAACVALSSAGDTTSRAPPGTIVQPYHSDPAHCLQAGHPCSRRRSRKQAPALTVLCWSLLLYCFKIGCRLQERKHSGTWRLVPGDASSLETWQSVASLLPRQHSLSGQHTFVLMLEVLDNLPHDRWDLKGQGCERKLT